MSRAIKVVIRTTDKVTKKRRWVLATGKKTDPQGPLYLRFCVGSKPHYEHTGSDRYDVALAAKIKLERKLKAQELGAVIPEEPAAPAPKEHHRIIDVTEAHVVEESKPDKNGDVRSAKSLGSIRSEMAAFVKWSGKTFVDELTRETMVGYRDWLLTVGKDGEPYQPDTAYNKLMLITTILKNNPLCPTKPLLPVNQFPDKKNPPPDPFTEEEFDRFMLHASYEDALLIYFFAVTGMRKMEVANAKKSDINWELNEISVVKKRDLGFLGKTPAALRDMPLPDDLLAELALLPEGLLFPGPEGGVTEHFGDRIEKIAKRAKITPTTSKPHMISKGAVKDDWCHRWRDTAITNQLELSCKSMADMLRLIKRIGHSDGKTLEKYFGRLAKPYVPKFPERHRRAKKVIVKGASAA